jgi:hypothetical protein
MTRRQNRIGESMALLPDGDTGPSILGETRRQINGVAFTAPLVNAAPSQHDTDIKGY